MDDLEEFLKKWRFLPHPDAERFDAVTLSTVERWKESELSGDEWRFSYIAEFYQHGEIVAQVSAGSIADLLVTAADQYKKATPTQGQHGDLRLRCCQPGCSSPWVVLLHPVKAYTRQGEMLAANYPENAVRGFCKKHEIRGDCALDDADHNYVKVFSRATE